MRTTSVQGRRFISLEEGRAKWNSTRKLYFPYRDQIGKWTIGVGHLIRDHELARCQAGLTDDEVDELLGEDLRKVDEAIEGIRWPRPRTQNEHDALASWLINVGVEWAKAYKKSSVVMAIESRNYASVPAALVLYDVADGKHREFLRARRIREGALFMTPDGADMAGVQKLSMIAADLKLETERAAGLQFSRLDLLSEADLG